MPFVKMSHPNGDSSDLKGESQHHLADVIWVSVTCVTDHFLSEPCASKCLASAPPSREEGRQNIRKHTLDAAKYILGHQEPCILEPRPVRTLEPEVG